MLHIVIDKVNKLLACPQMILRWTQKLSYRYTVFRSMLKNDPQTGIV